MGQPPNTETPPLADGGGVSKLDRLAGAIEVEDSHSPASPQRQYHADHLIRRCKTDAELVASCGFIALRERRGHR